MAKPKSKIRFFIQLVIVTLALIVLIPKTRELIDNREILNKLSISWLVVGGGVMLSSNFFAALVIKLLSYRRLSYTKILAVQFANGFTNRLLPGGVGGMSTNSLFFIKSGYPKTEAISLALTNNVVGFLAFCLVLAVTGTLSPKFLAGVFGDFSSIYYWFFASLVLILIFSTAIWQRLRTTLINNTKQAFVVVRELLKRPLWSALAIVASTGITFCCILALYCCAEAAGITMSLSELVLVFSAGAVAVSASPTPGGLGGTELAMALSMEKLSFEASPSLAVVFAFRLASYWLPLLPGYLVLRYVSIRKII